jgi:hypothetical protein
VWNVTIVGGDSNVVYAATKRAGVYKSTDALTAQAPTWLRINNGIRNNLMGRAAPVIVEPDNVQVLYVGSEGGGGVFRSTDGGDSWSAINFGLDENLGVWVGSGPAPVRHSLRMRTAGRIHDFRRWRVSARPGELWGRRSVLLAWIRRSSRTGTESDHASHSQAGR